MYRLVAYAPDGVQRFPVARRELVIGSRPGCDVYLPYTGIAREHARVVFDGTDLRIEDLGSRRGVLVSGKRVKEALLEVLDEVRLGGVTLLVEDVVPEEDGGAAAAETESPPPAPPAMTAERMLDHIARISEWVLTDRESRVTSESLMTAVLGDFGGGVLLLLQGELRNLGLKLVVVSEDSWLASGEGLVEQLREHLGEAPPPSEGIAFEGQLSGHRAWVCAHFFTAVERTYVLLVALPRFSAEPWSPLSALKTLGDLLVLGLVHHVGWYEPILPGRRAQQDLTLDPGLVVGESSAMRQVLERLRSAVDPPVHVLLRGEPGVGRELLARSLHLSGPRRNGPFVAATVGGGKPLHVEADLFGAEVPGKEGPLRREGKLALADGGTLFLDSVEELPLEVQARLVRFLRSGEVEPSGSTAVRKVDVRIIAASNGPLEPAVARDLFRVDLAYRLSRFAIDVPPLRNRREDLPLILQSYINRFCHETGKRVAGITVKAMSSLLAYGYPGNLAEVENIVRQLVYLCPSGQPIDVNHLPEKVRLASVQSGAEVDAASDLSLERLVASTEASAIREALRRTQGNKSHAARLLGLSRNGLTMKMERYGLQG